MITEPTHLEVVLGGLLAGVAFCALGLLLLLVGVVMVDLLTPGKLSKLIYEDRNWNAAVIVAANVFAVGTIVVTSIYTSAFGLRDGLLDTAGYGLLGILVLALAFVVVDVLTPGRLGHLITEDKLHPAILVTASTTLVVGAVIAAAIA